MKSVPVDDQGFVNIEKLIEIIDDTIGKKTKITPLLKTEQLKNFNKKLKDSNEKSKEKSLTKKEIFNGLFYYMKQESEFDKLLVLKVG